MPTDEAAEFEHDESRFIDGVFNYCDRWCEKCRFNDRCRVYDQELAMKERHEILGEDPSDPKLVMEDVAATFEQTMEMLKKMAEEMGVDLSEAPPEPRRRRRSDIGGFPRHSLFKRAEQWMDRVEEFLDTM